MAKKNATKNAATPVVRQTMRTNGDLQMVPLHRLAWSHERINTSRQTVRGKADSDKLMESLARQGWNIQKGIICAFGENSPIYNDYQDVIDTVYKERCSQLQWYYDNPSVKDGVKVEHPELQHFINALCVMEERDVDNGKGGTEKRVVPCVVRPDLIANTCNGRLTVYFDSQVLRAKGISGTTDLEAEIKLGASPPLNPIWQVPVEIALFKDDAARVKAQVDENSKGEDFIEPSPRDKLYTVAWFFKHQQMTQSEARDMYPGTIGQKAWLICQLDYLWSNKCTAGDRFKGEPTRPNLHILDNCLANSNDDGWYNFTSMNDVKALTRLIERSSPDSLNKRNEKIARNNNALLAAGNDPSTLDKMLCPVKADEVEDYFKQFKKGAKREGNTPKILEKSKWEGLKRSDCVIVREIAEAHLDADTGAMNRLNENADLYNLTYEVVEKQKDEYAKLALQIILSEHPDLDRFLALASKGRIKIEPAENGSQVEPTQPPAEQPPAEQPPAEQPTV